MRRFLRPPWSVRTYLIAFGGAVLAPLLLVLGVGLNNIVRSEVATAHNDLARLASDASADIDREILGFITVLETLASSAEVSTSDYAGLHALARKVLAPRGVNLLLLDPMLQQLVNTRVPYGTVLPKSSDPQGASSAIALRKPTVSNLFYGSVSKNWVVNISWPVIDAGKVKYVLLIALDAARIGDVLNASQLPDEWILKVTDSNGRLINSRPGQATLPVIAQSTRLKEPGQNAFEVLADSSGQRWVEASLWSQISGWRVSAIAMKSKLEASLWGVLSLLGGVTLMSIGLTTALAAALGRRLTQPIARLRDAATHLTMGKLIEPEPLAIAEIDDLMRAVSRASELISSRTARLQESERRYGEALRTGRMGSWITDFSTQTREWSPEALVLFGLKIDEGRGVVGGEHDEFLNALHPEDRGLYKTFHTTAAQQDEFEAEYRIKRPDGEIRWLSGRGRVVSRKPGGAAKRIVSIVADITERKDIERHNQFLMNELLHRTKNMLAVVQSLARQTVRNSESLEDFEHRYGQRLRGLATSIDVLTSQNWTGASLSDLITQQIAPFSDGRAAAITITGPQLLIDAQSAQSIGLALHELATNSVKYGSLSVPSGSVTISWSNDPIDQVPHLVLRWVEHGGPPVVAPKRRGFGQVVIETMVAQSTGGKVALDFVSDGLRWTLTVALEDISPNRAQPLGVLPQVHAG